MKNITANIKIEEILEQFEDETSQADISIDLETGEAGIYGGYNEKFCYLDDAFTEFNLVLDFYSFAEDYEHIEDYDFTDPEFKECLKEFFNGEYKQYDIYKGRLEDQNGEHYHDETWYTVESGYDTLFDSRYTPSDYPSEEYTHLYNITINYI